MTERSEEAVAAGLLDAQVKAQGLFAAVETRGIIRLGATEREINENVYALADEMYGVLATGTNVSCERAGTLCRRMMRTLLT